MYLVKAKRQAGKIMSVGLSFVLIFSHIFPPDALAGRSNAGGGDLAEFDIGKVAMSVGISLGSMAVGSALNAGISSISQGAEAGASSAGISTNGYTLFTDVLTSTFDTGFLNEGGALATGGGVSNAGISTTLFTDVLTSTFDTGFLNEGGAFATGLGSISGISIPTQGFSLPPATPSVLSAMGNAFTNSFSIPSMATNFSTFAATSQVGRAVGMAGNYYGWDPSTTFLVSNIASSATGGFLNPSVALGTTISDSVMPEMAKGALVGGLTGLASGGVIVAIDGDSINNRESPGITAQIASMVSSVAMGNFARALVNPATYSEKIDVYKKVDNPENANNARKSAELSELAGRAAYYDYGDNTAMASEFYQEAQKYAQLPKHVYQEVLETYPFTGKNPELGPKLSSSDLEEKYRGMSGRIEPLGDYLRVIQTNANLGALDVGAKLLDATFIKTADMWPQLAMRSLSILAVDSLGKDNQKFASVVSLAVEGIANPALSGLADSFALRPGLYVGENHISNSIGYIESMFKRGYTVPLNKVGEEVYTVYEEFKDDLANKNLPEDYRAYRQEQYRGALQKVIDNNKLKISIVDPMELIENTRAKLSEQLIPGDPGEKWVQSQLELLNESASKLETKYDPKIHMGLLMTQVRIALEEKMKSDIKQGKTLDQVFADIGASRASLFLDSALENIKFGLVEGAISGGTSYLISQLAKDNPAAAYGAAMLTSALRGAIWYATWEDDNRDLKWMPKDTLYIPKPPKPYEKGDDWVEQQVSQYIYDQQLAKVNEFGKVSGLRLVERDRKVGDKIERVSGYELDFKNQKPDLSAAILISLAQTNREFLNRAFAFGAPQTEPKHINTFMMADYFKQLNSYAMSANSPGWFERALTSGLISGGSSAISSNILTSLASVKPIAEALDMQRQRLVLTGGKFVTTNLNPLTIQTIDYKPWALGLETRYYLPFPSDSYRAKSRSGKSFIKE